MILCFLKNQFLRRHAEECPACRAASRVHAALQKAPAPQVSAPPFLRARIMNSVRSSAPAARPVSLVWRIAPALGVTVLLVFLVLRQQAPPEPKASLIAATPDEPALELPPLPAPLLVVERPLEQEIASLQADTLNAAQALAESFLPASFSR